MMMMMMMTLPSSVPEDEEEETADDAGHGDVNSNHHACYGSVGALVTVTLATWTIKNKHGVSCQKKRGCRPKSLWWLHVSGGTPEYNLGAAAARYY